ncbi:hypothetical protein T484DRAFT_1908756, partial [Baffinella frigidus]
MQTVIKELRQRIIFTVIKGLCQRIIFVRNLPKDMTPAKYQEMFGQFGEMVKVWLGTRSDVAGTAYVAYAEPDQALRAMHSLTGLKVQDKYLIVYLHNPKRM